MEYFDIDSTYRNRVLYPNQADFNILQQQDHSYDGVNSSFRDIVSNETIVYPNPTLNPVLAYYEETIQVPFDTIVSRPNLPLMYSTSDDNTVQLDELVIASVYPTSTSITSSSLYPRNSIPLAETDEAYIGFILEDVENKEYRTITDFNYDDTIDNVFQTGSIQDDTTLVNGSNFITINTLNRTQLPFSNIDRFYQGKFFKMLTGNAKNSKRLILNYTTSSMNQYTFELESSFGVEINIGDTFAIVSDRKWFVTLDRPFTNMPGSYPSYRNLVPRVRSWNPVIISKNFSDTQFMRLTLQGRDTQGAQNLGLDILTDNGTVSAIGGFPLGNITHLVSSNKTGEFGFREVFQVDDIILASKFASVYVQNINAAATVVSDDFTPNLIYAQAGPGAGKYSIKLLRGLDKDGLTWSDTADIIQTYTSGIVIDQKISAVASADGQTIFAAWGIVVGGTHALIFYESATPSVIAVEFNLGGDEYQVIDVQLFQDAPGIYVRVGGDFAYYQFDGAVFNLFPINNPNPAYRVMKYIDHDSFTPIVNAQELLATSADILTGDVEKPNSVPLFNVPTLGFVNNFYQSFRFNRTRIVQGLFEDDLLVFILGTDEANNRLWIVENFSTALLDDNPVTSIDMIQNYNGEPFVVYSRIVDGQTEIVSLNLTNFITQKQSFYRIRRNPPLQSGTGQENRLLDSTLSTITLPNSITFQDDFLKSTYLHLTNYPFVQLDTTTLFNEFLFITDYDSDTNTITFTPSLTTSPSTILANSFGNNSAIFLEMKNPLDIGEDSSPNNYDHTIEGNVIYVNTITDITGLTLDDVIQGSEVPVDTNRLIRTYTPTDIDINRVMQGFRVNFSTWFLLTINPAPVIIHLMDINGADSFLRITIEDLFFHIRFDSSVGSADITDAFQVNPIIELNTWYHFVYLHTEFGVTIYLNKQNITDRFSLESGGIVLAVENLGFSQLEGEFVAETIIGMNLTGYMKNTLLTGEPFDEKMVVSNYDSTFNVNNYVSWEILANTSQNFQPLGFTGSRTLSGLKCYELELTHLVLPNVILESQFGNRVAFYPYVYVKFFNLDNSLQRNFYSNNPNARSVMFKVPIRDTSTPDSATFVKNQAVMSLVSTFDPTGNFSFTIYLPTGELFKTAEKDTLPPLLPNFLLQVSLTIGYRSKL